MSRVEMFVQELLAQELLATVLAPPANPVHFGFVVLLIVVHVVDGREWTLIGHGH